MTKDPHYLLISLSQHNNERNYNTPEAPHHKRYLFPSTTKTIKKTHLSFNKSFNFFILLFLTSIPVCDHKGKRKWGWCFTTEESVCIVLVKDLNPFKIFWSFPWLKTLYKQILQCHLLFSHQSFQHPLTKINIYSLLFYI